MSSAAVVLVCLVVLGTVGAVRRARRARQKIGLWAAAEGFEITSLQYRWFGLHPFLWAAGRSRLVYDIEVIDPEGRPRTGLVRVSGFFGTVQARWNDS